LSAPQRSEFTESVAIVHLGRSFRIGHARFLNLAVARRRQATRRLGRQLRSERRAPCSRRRPPALIQTAEHDPLCDEVEAWGERLRDADVDVDVTVTRYDCVVHGFVSRWTQMARAEAAHDDAGAGLRAALQTGSARISTAHSAWRQRSFALRSHRLVRPSSEAALALWDRHTSTPTTATATGTPTSQPHRNTTDDVDDAFPANRYHMAIIARTSTAATPDTCLADNRAAAISAIAGPRVKSAVCGPDTNGSASDQTSLVHVHNDPADDPRTAASA